MSRFEEELIIILATKIWKKEKKFVTSVKYFPSLLPVTTEDKKSTSAVTLNGVDKLHQYL